MKETSTKILSKVLVIHDSRKKKPYITKALKEESIRIIKTQKTIKNKIFSNLNRPNKRIYLITDLFL